MLLLLALLAATPDLAGYAGQQPQLAGAGNIVYLTVARDNRIAVLRSSDGGRTFEETSTIAPGGQLAAGRHRGPRIAVSDHTIVVSAIIGAEGGGKDGD